MQEKKAKLEKRDQDENKQIKELKDHLESIQKALLPIKQKMAETQKYMLSEVLNEVYENILKELPGYQTTVEKSLIEDDEDEIDNQIKEKKEKVPPLHSKSKNIQKPSK